MSGVEEVLAAHRLVDLYQTGDEQVVAVRCACREFSTDQFDGLEARHAAHVAEQLQPLIRQAQAEAVAEVARTWQINAWADVLLPAPKPPAVPSIAYGQRVTDWLRDRADRLAGDA